MNPEWIISLAAVLVSMVTIIISYLTNKENLKHASSNMVSERKLDFRVSVWKEIIDISDKLLLATNYDHFERLINTAVVGKNNDTSDEVVLNVINDDCENIRSLVFNLCSRIKVLDMPNKALRDRIRKYGNDVIDIYKKLQEFYLDRNATRSAFDGIVRTAQTFADRSKTFSRTMQDYISELQNRLFGIFGESGKNENNDTDKRGE